MSKVITISETDQAVADYLKANHIHFSSRYLGEKRYGTTSKPAIIGL